MVQAAPLTRIIHDLVVVFPKEYLRVEMLVGRIITRTKGADLTITKTERGMK
jgi:hypothetical protein